MDASTTPTFLVSYINADVAQIFANHYIEFWIGLLVVLYPLYLVRKIIFT